MSWTFTTLKTAIQDYVDNNESTFVTNLPIFITETEDRILDLVDLPYFRKNATGTISSGNKYLAMPTDFLAPFSLSLTSSSDVYFLINKDVNFMQESFPTTTTTARPEYYAIFDTSNFIVGPTPDANYDAEIHYLYRPTSITTAASGTTWLGTNATDAMLYGSLMEAYTFMKGEPDLINEYKQRFERAIARLKNLGEARMNKDQYRNGKLRIQES
jgi:hypothetical protein|tara:strand:+ start:214 stop:858 length:645 start_codon:yes stop_codon:yes gene_type:complete